MSVTNPIEGFLDLIKLRETLDTTQRAKKATQNALNSLKKFEAQMDASTIKRLEAQLKKMDTAVGKGIKALSTASKKKLPQELKDAYKQGLKVLKKTLPASVFGKPSYSYGGENYGYGTFYIWLPLQDYKSIGFKMIIEFEKARDGYRGWNGWVSAQPAKVKTKIEYFFNGSYRTRGDIPSLLEDLKNDGYVHYPNMSNIQAEKEVLKAKLEQDIKRLPRWLDGQVEENRGQLYIEVEGRAEMRWEYDQDHMTWTEWENQAEAEITDSLERIKKVLPNYEYSSGGMGEKGHYTITLTPKK